MQINSNYINYQPYKPEQVKLDVVKLAETDIIRPIEQREMSKVEFIKQQLEDNTYKINLNKTAEKLAQALI